MTGDQATEDLRLIATALDEVANSPEGTMARLSALSPATPGGPGSAQAARSAGWRNLSDLGVLEYELPVAEGGMELGLQAGALVAGQLGQRGWLSPHLDTVHALDLLLDVPEAKEQARQAICAGSAIVFVDAARRYPGAPPHGADGPRLDVAARAGGIHVTGVAHCAGRLVDHAWALVVVPVGDDRAAFLLPVDGVSVREADGQGESAVTRLALELALPLSDLLPLSPARYRLAVPRLRLRQAAYLVGLSEGALRSAVEHTRSRAQFGHPLSEFQAVRFAVAQQWALVQGCSALLAEAIRATELTGGQDRDLLANETLALAIDSARQATLAALHLHGAGGLARASGAQSAYRQAVSLGVLWGPPSALRRKVAARLGSALRSADRAFDPDYRLTGTRLGAESG
jgi:alkylation response protein AidB-like acyl-CoA dehydrogenase